MFEFVETCHAYEYSLVSLLSTDRPSPTYQSGRASLPDRLRGTTPQVPGAEHGLGLSEAVLRLRGAEPAARARLDRPDEDAACPGSGQAGDAATRDGWRRVGTAAGDAAMGGTGGGIWARDYGE